MFYLYVILRMHLSVSPVFGISIFFLQLYSTK